MSSGSSSSWLEGWSGAHHGWSDYPSPEPAASEPALDERDTSALHNVQDLLQQTTVLSERRSKKMLTEGGVSISKGNAAYAAMEAAIRAREWKEEAEWLNDQKKSRSRGS